MGVTYAAVCHTCKQFRDLDKAGIVTPRTFSMANETCEDLKTSRKLHNVLIGFSFFQDHMGHFCTMQSDTMSQFDVEAAGYEEDVDKYDPTR